MATTPEAARYVLEKLGHAGRFEARPMFGEYGLYADDRFVGAICDDQLYVKILPASAALEGVCDQDAPYPGAKPHYLVEESQLSTLDGLASVLLAVAASLPEKRKPGGGGKRKPSAGGGGKGRGQGA